jgi:hypothetical protein
LLILALMLKGVGGGVAAGGTPGATSRTDGTSQP